MYMIFVKYTDLTHSDWWWGLFNVLLLFMSLASPWWCGTELQNVYIIMYWTNEIYFRMEMNASISGLMQV